MKLYYFPHSPNTRKVLTVVHHLGLKIDLEMVDLIQGAQMQPEYLELNPNHMTPTLADGNFVLWESNAIMQYLAAQTPGNELWPSDARTQADISRWQCWQLAHWGPACQPIIWERMVKPMLGQGEPDAQIVAEAEERFHRFAAVLNGCLAGRPWLVGKSATLADFAVAADLMYKDAAQLPVSSYTEIQRWYEGVEEVEAWQKAAPPAMG
jgi:glutathione S-transferase